MNSRVLPFELGIAGGGLHGAADPADGRSGRHAGTGAGYGGGKGPRAPRGGGPSPEEPDRVDVRALGHMLWRRRKAVAAAVAGGMLLAFLATRMMTPSYTGLAKVMLQTNSPQAAAAGDTSSSVQLNDQMVNSEVSVLRSNVLIRAAITQVGPDKLAALDPANRKPSLVARAVGAVTGLFGGGDSGPAPDQNSAAADEARVQRLSWVVAKELSITREGQSYVLDIKVENPDPVLAASLANALADQYLASQVADRRAAATSASKFLAGRVAELQKTVSAAEDRVEKFRAANLLVDGGTLDAARQQLGELNNQLISARADQIAAQARYERIQQVVAKGGLAAVASIVSSPTLDTLSSKLMDLQRQDAIWAQHYGPTHPERVRLAAEIKGVQKDLNAEVGKLMDQRKNDADIAGIRVSTLKDSIKQMETRIVSLSRSTIGLRQLERQATAARASYDKLLNRLTDAETQAQMERPGAQVIERAEVAGAPSSPRTKLLMALGGVLGLIFGVAGVFFAELTSTTFRSVAETERETGLPVLTAIPRGAWKSPLGAWRELAQNPYGLYAERIRHLRTALLMQGGKAGGRSVMMASSTPGEGKTTTVLALARMAALAGKKVIVVDCDLRRSMLYRQFGWTPQGRDFADFIANDCALAEAIRHDEDLGFDVLAAARGRPDVADELAAEWLGPMFDALKRKYDLVLVDAPAMLAVSDALVIGQAVDSALYLVRWNDTPRSAVAKALSDCDEAGLHMAGVVVTMVDPRMSPDVYAGGYEYSA